MEKIKKFVKNFVGNCVKDEKSLGISIVLLLVVCLFLVSLVQESIVFDQDLVGRAKESVLDAKQSVAEAEQTFVVKFYDEDNNFFDSYSSVI